MAQGLPVQCETISRDASKLIFSLTLRRFSKGGNKDSGPQRTWKVLLLGPRLQHRAIRRHGKDFSALHKPEAREVME